MTDIWSPSGLVLKWFYAQNENQRAAFRLYDMIMSGLFFGDIRFRTLDSTSVGSPAVRFCYGGSGLQGASSVRSCQNLYIQFMWEKNVKAGILI